jgi:hypothetical protein
LIGDSSPGFGTPLGGNGFIRVLPTGFVDSGFNPGGAGFLNVNPAASARWQFSRTIKS